MGTRYKYRTTGDCTWKIVNGIELIISGNGKMEDYSSSSAPWYGYRSSIKKVTIGDGVTSIGSYAFKGFIELTSVTIGNSVIYIGGGAFEYCTGLTSVIIPDSVKSIGYEAFCDCTGLLSVTVGSGVTSIGPSAFYNCRGLTSIGIPDSVKSIYDSAFEYCTGLISVTIPNSVTSIGPFAFGSCRGLISVTLGKSVTNIGSYAFQYCNKLIEIINHSKLNITAGSHSYEYVVYYAMGVHKGNESKVVNKNGYLFYTFNNINYLIGYIGNDTALVLPNNYNGENYEIYHYAFYECEGLTSVTIPDGVTSIGSYAFSDCGALISAAIPNSVKNIGSSAFSGCPVTIYCEIGSETEKYALANGIKFAEMPSKIEIFNMPDKLIYNINSELDLEGLIVTIYYSSGLLEFRYKDFEVSGFDTSTAGTKSVTIGYLGATASFDIEVILSADGGNDNGKTDVEDRTVLKTAYLPTQNTAKLLPPTATAF